ncbi:cadmium-translocating P-type ATPase [Paracoccus sp. S-4012]|uniref:heavy metal translocating P-type ATPase n=1 Tax=Paracoccus sp. S-4012 TaxID=2665648 RepID=UPI0012AF1630|nr:heavy metal translocating P-type ATPase [Paracoccus sp. S-4012]MRX50876.1 cadmium-translocating P-type ATPase [Paracoccus sp. S-4012]
MTDLSTDARLTGPRLAACPACDVAPLAARQAASARAQPRGDVILSLPTIHCAACIADVERALKAMPGVRSARVNLTLRRVTIDAPGMEAEALIPVLDAAGYEAHELDPGALSATAADRQGRDILMRIGVAGFAMMNVMILAVSVWSGAEDATRDLFHWIQAAIALPTIAFSGQPFFKSAWRALRAGRLNMDVPISLALILASGISLYETWQGGDTAWFDGVVMLCFFLLIGRYLDYRSRAVARSAAEELTALEVPRATRLEGGAEAVVPVAELGPGDLILVRPGGRIPADGTVAEGMSEVDRSLLTGETIPVVAGPGMALSAGEVNLTGPLTLRVSTAGRDTTLSRLTELVASAESARTRYTTLAERASRLYAPVVHLVAFTTFLGWLAGTGDVRLAINIAAAVLIITCPCALGLAVPAVVTVASGRLFRRGLLIKDGTALERLAEARVAVFDKTGTLTLGTPRLADPEALPEAARPVARALAGASSHPLSRALAAALGDVVPAPVEELREVPGRGVEGFWQGRRVRLGRADWLGVEDEGHEQASWLSLGQGVPIRLAFHDSLRPGAEEAVAGLRAAGMRVILLSGDGPGPVGDIAARLGIAEWQAGIDPEGKAAVIRRLQAEGAGSVLMVGDGLNDTVALAAADVAISPASALDAARAASDIVLIGRDLAPVADGVTTARASRNRIRENFGISFGYNIIAVPIAILGFATPLMAALAMSLSSITVTLNALRLR